MALEKQEGCGIGNGVALPHLRLPGADQFIALFVRNRHRLSFSTVDNTPVDILCLLVSPADAPADHLRRLSRLTRLLRDETTLSRLRAAESRDVVEVILKNDTPNIRHVA
jgi:PTS system nitrogen regulatory IIA component